MTQVERLQLELTEARAATAEVQASVRQHMEVWGDIGRYREVWGDVGRCREM